MAQARALGAAEMEQVLEHVNAGRHAHRNRCFILLTHLAGLRVGEVASLRWLDVMTADGQIKDEVRLLPEMTKGKHARTVFISTRLRQELQQYADIYRRAAPLDCPLFYSQKGDALGLYSQFVDPDYRQAVPRRRFRRRNQSQRATHISHESCKQRHSDPLAAHIGWASQHQHHCHLPVQ